MNFILLYEKGAYITMEDALNEAISSEGMWKEGKFQEAISLVAVRALFLERGRDLIENDLTKLHGKALQMSIVFGCG